MRVSREFLLDKGFDLLIAVPVGSAILWLYGFVWGHVPWQLMVVAVLISISMIGVVEFVRYERRRADLLSTSPNHAAIANVVRQVVRGDGDIPSPVATTMQEMTRSQATLYGIKTGVVDPSSPEAQRALTEICAIRPGNSVAAGNRKRNMVANEAVLYLADLPPSEVHSLSNLYADQWLAGKKLAHSLTAHPKQLPAGPYVSFIVFDLPSGYHQLSGTAAIADLYESDRVTKVSHSSAPLIFEILGDGKTLWTSRTLQQSADSEPFQVKITGVNVLKLSVNCRGQNGFAWAVWIEPAISI